MLTQLKNAPAATKILDGTTEIRLSARMNQADELLADITREFNKRLDDLEQFRIRIAPLLKYISDDGVVDLPAAAAPDDVEKLTALLEKVRRTPAEEVPPAHVTFADRFVSYKSGMIHGIERSIKALTERGTDGDTGAGGSEQR